MSFEKKAKRLSSRDWTDVCALTIANFSSLDFSFPGIQPEYVLADHAGLPDLIRGTASDGEGRPADSVRFAPACLHDGIFMLHKSANVLVAAHDQAVGGLPTWSIATAYQAAFLAADAILKLLGVAVLTVDNMPCTIDLWPEPTGLKGKALASYKLGSELQIVRHAPIQHHHKWFIFQRVLRGCSSLDWDEQIVKVLLSLDERAIARQRNNLQYDSTWRFGDLSSYQAHAGYFLLNDKPSLFNRLDPDREDFTIALGTTLVSLGSCLLRQIAAVSTTAMAEYQLLSSACTEPRMKLRSQFEGCGAPVLV